MCMSGCFCCANVIVVCVCARSTKQHTSNNMLYQHLAKRCEAKNTKGTGTYIIYDYNHIHTHTRAHADCALLPFIIWKNANGTGITASKCVNMWNDFESSTGGYIVINDCHHGHTHIHTWISVLSGVRDVFFHIFAAILVGMIMKYRMFVWFSNVSSKKEAKIIGYVFFDVPLSLQRI